MAAPKLGIIAGGGTLPARLAKVCRASGREYFLLAILGHADSSLLEDEPHAWIRMGDGGKGIERLRVERVKELVFAGQVRRPSLRELRPDGYTLRFFARLGGAWIGDDSLLAAIVRTLEQEGFSVIGPDSLLENCLSVSGPYGRIAPGDDARRDIERGLDVVRAIGALDIGQAAVVQHGIVLGVEGAEGTDELIRRCGALQREGPGGILVKARKPGQERRIDLPTIGTDTVRQAIASGLSGIAVEAGGALVFDRDRIASLADDAGLFVVGV
jgi:hypothetical protein